MVPFQSDMRRSSGLSKPYEQASRAAEQTACEHRFVRITSVSSSPTFILGSDLILHLPAPRPFSPFSSSSSRRKFRGTLAMTVDM